MVGVVVGLKRVDHEPVSGRVTRPSNGIRDRQGACEADSQCDDEPSSCRHHGGDRPDRIGREKFTIFGKHGQKPGRAPPPHPGVP